MAFTTKTSGGGRFGGRLPGLHDDYITMQEN